MRSVCWSVVSRIALHRGCISCPSARCSTTQVKESIGNEQTEKVVKRNTQGKEKDKLLTVRTEEKGGSAKVKRSSEPGIDVGKLFTKKLTSSLSHGTGNSKFPPSASHGLQEEETISRALKVIKKENSVKNLVMKIDTKMVEFQSHKSKQIILVAGLKKIENLGVEVKTEDINNILTYFVNNYQQFSNETLGKCVTLILRSYNPDEHIRDLLLHIMASSVGKMTIKQIISLCFTAIHDIEFKSKIENICLEELAKRITDITDPLDLLKVLNVHRHEKNKLAMLKFENRIKDVVDKMSDVTLWAVLMRFSRNYVRNTPVILSLIHHIQKSSSELSVDQINQILWSCVRLSIYDETLMKTLCNGLLSADLSKNMDSFQILVHLGKLRWQEKNLLLTLINNIFNAEKPKLSANKRRDLVHILCQLNFCPDSILEHIQLSDLMSTDSLSCLSFVWDCTVLQRASAEMMSSVLEENFIEKVKQDCGNEDKFLVYKSKLIHINCASCFDVENYHGPHLSDLQDTYLKTKDKGTLQLTTDIFHCMNSILPESEYYRKYVNTPQGYRIDAELFVNSNGEAVKIQDTVESQEGLYRVALKVLGFHDTLQPDRIPTGPEAMVIRHLGCQGYKVLLIPYYEWNELNNPEKKKKYIENKIKSVIS